MSRRLVWLLLTTVLPLVSGCTVLAVTGAAVGAGAAVASTAVSAGVAVGKGVVNVATAPFGSEEKKDK
jgi:hypothetical protein